MNRALRTALLAAVVACDATRPEPIVAAIDILEPAAGAIIEDSVVRIRGVARVPRGGSVVELRWLLTGSSQSDSLLHEAFPPNPLRLEEVPFTFELKVPRGGYELTLSMYYFADPQNTNETFGVTRAFRRAGPHRFYLVDGVADTLFQRSLMLTVRDSAVGGSLRYATLLLDRGTANEKMIDYRATSNSNLPPQEWLSATTLRLFYPDTLAPGNHTVLIRMYDETGMIDSIPASVRLALPSVQYALSVLPSLGGTEANAVAINEGGEIAGWSLDATGRKRAAVWRSGNVEALDTDTSSAVAINNSGVIFGTITTTSTCGARWQGGTRTILTTPGGSCVTAVLDANNAGTVLGVGGGNVLLRSDGSMTAIVSPLGTAYWPNSVNDQELIVGYQRTIGLENRALGLGFTGDFPIAHQFPNGGPHWSSIVNRINNAGQFIGSASYSSMKLFFGQAGTETVDLSGALSINRAPALVGLNDNGVVASFHYATQQGFLWSAGRTTRFSVADQDWTIDAISDLNNATWMVGRATHKTSGEKRAILLTPE